MQFKAKVRNIRFSPYKLRLLADVVRGKNTDYALNFLRTYPIKRAVPLRKMIESAVANAKDLSGMAVDNLFIKEIRIDQGTIHRYFKPGARGRANEQKKRFSHMSVILERKEV